MEDQAPSVKLFFGLSPIQTLLNALVILTLSAVCWVISFMNQVPLNYPQESINELQISVPWYVDGPFFILSIIMLLRWVEYYFKIKEGDYSIRTILYKYVYLFLFLMTYTTLIKFILLFILL